MSLPQSRVWLALADAPDAPDATPSVTVATLFDALLTPDPEIQPLDPSQARGIVTRLALLQQPLDAPLATVAEVTPSPVVAATPAVAAAPAPVEPATAGLVPVMVIDGRAAHVARGGGMTVLRDVQATRNLRVGLTLAVASIPLYLDTQRHYALPPVRMLQPPVGLEAAYAAGEITPAAFERHYLQILNSRAKRLDAWVLGLRGDQQYTLVTRSFGADTRPGIALALAQWLATRRLALGCAAETLPITVAL